MPIEGSDTLRELLALTPPSTIDGDVKYEVNKSITEIYALIYITYCHDKTRLNITYLRFLGKPSSQMISSAEWLIDRSGPSSAL